MADNEILFTNAAIQNRSFDLDSRPGKVMGIMAAQLLNRIVENPDVVHIWNNVGLFDETEPTSPDARLHAKYKSYTLGQHLDHWAVGDRLALLTDEDLGFGEWATDLLDSCLGDGDIYIKEADFSCCVDCNLVIAESIVEIHECGKCGSGNIEIRNESALFVDTPDDRHGLLPAERMYNLVNLHQERDSMKQVPPRLLLSRTRNRGISLESLGLGGRVMEPRLGIGLLALYAAGQRGYEKGCLVQSASTLVRTAPYLNAVITDPNRQQVPEPYFAAHAKVDQKLLADSRLTPTERNVLLPLASLRRRNDVTTNDLEALRSERAKVINKTESVEVIFGRLGLGNYASGVLPASFRQVVSEGKLNDLLPEISRVLGWTVQDLKRISMSEVTDDICSAAGPINRLLEFDKSVFAR